MFASAFFALPSAGAPQCVPSETHKLLANGGAEDDKFGFSVAISDTTAIVGAPFAHDNGSGSAYLFDTTTGRQIANLLPKDGAEGDRFGYFVAISGTTAIVGAFHDGDNGLNSGSAYLFDTNTGQQIAKLLPSDGAAGDGFGRAVAINGTTAIIGAIGHDENGASSGAAYLFDTTTGRQIAKLLADDGAAGDRFGYSVAISGTIAIVGAKGDDAACPGFASCSSGSAYLFDTATGRQVAKLVPDDGASHDHFGYSVAIDGTIAIIGAYHDDDNGSNSGSAYLFDTTTGRQIAKLLAGDGAPHDEFGVSVGISGTVAIVGARFDDANGDFSGSAYLVDISDPANPTLIVKLLAGDGVGREQFGHSVAISGEIATIGAPGDDDNGLNSGSAYLFDLNCGIPALRIVGSCPGPMEFQVSNVTPGGQIAFLYAFGRGSVTIPAGNPCAGTLLGLNATVRLGTVVRADANGVATVIANIPAQACGNIFAQALDIESCATSNTLGL